MDLRAFLILGIYLILRTESNKSFCLSAKFYSIKFRKYSGLSENKPLVINKLKLSENIVQNPTKDTTRSLRVTIIFCAFSSKVLLL